MRLTFSLCPEDRERFGGPEWVTFDEAELADVPVDTLERWEKPLLAHYDMPLLDMVAEVTGPKVTFRSVRAMLWIAYQRAGVNIEFDAFAPRLMDPQVRVRQDDDPTPEVDKGDDAAPPAQTEGGPSSPPSSVDHHDAAGPDPANSTAPSPPS